MVAQKLYNHVRFYKINIDNLSFMALYLTLVDLPCILEKLTVHVFPNGAVSFRACQLFSLVLFINNQLTLVCISINYRFRYIDKDILGSKEVLSY